MGRISTAAWVFIALLSKWVIFGVVELFARIRARFSRRHRRAAKAERQVDVLACKEYEERDLIHHAERIVLREKIRFLREKNELS